MSVLQKLPRSRGVSELFDLLAIINDPKRFEKHVKEIQEATEEHNKAVETLGIGRNIVKARADADKLQEQVNRGREDLQRKIQAQAKETKAAEEALRQRELDLAKREKALVDGAKAHREQVVKDKVDINAQVMEVKRREAVADAREQAAAKALEDAKVTKQQYESKLAQIRAVAQ